MGKLLNVRERIHQPIRDAYVRTSGFVAGTLTNQTDLFMTSGATDERSNVNGMAWLPNDSSMIVLGVRVPISLRKPQLRVWSGAGNLANNGDFGDTANAGGFVWPQGAGGLAAGNTWATIHDELRLHRQLEECVFWSVGAGEKFSLRSMPTAYFSAGCGTSGDIGSASDMIFLTNGVPSHGSLLRLGRAVTITPRQTIKVQANAYALGVGANAAAFGTTTAVGRDLMNVVNNCNVLDGMTKVCYVVLDGLISRDVQ